MLVPAAMTVFAVTRSRGPAWEHALPLEGQREWDAHAQFMDALEAAGVVVLGGPLEGTSEVLLIMRAASEEHIAEQLKDDPWTELDLLRTDRVVRWTIRLGRLATSPRT
jgi:hypothetical protein